VRARPTRIARTLRPPSAMRRQAPASPALSTPIALRRGRSAGRPRQRARTTSAFSAPAMRSVQKAGRFATWAATSAPAGARTRLSVAERHRFATRCSGCAFSARAAEIVRLQRPLATSRPRVAWNVSTIARARQAASAISRATLALAASTHRNAPTRSTRTVRPTPMRQSHSPVRDASRIEIARARMG
jgi:hypothetical protein